MDHRTRIELVDQPHEVTYKVTKREGINYDTYTTTATIEFPEPVLKQESCTVRVYPDTGFTVAACNSTIDVTSTHIDVSWNKDTILMTEHKGEGAEQWVCELKVKRVYLS
jgi:hypothetical protein